MVKDRFSMLWLNLMPKIKLRKSLGKNTLPTLQLKKALCPARHLASHSIHALDDLHAKDHAQQATGQAALIPAPMVKVHVPPGQVTFTMHWMSLMPKVAS